MKNKPVSISKKLWIGIGILVLLTPLGLIIPALFGAGGAWGEWGGEEIEKMIGYLPEGMKGLLERWKSPMPGYSVPAQRTGLAGKGIGYIISAVIGVILTAGAGYLLAKLLSNKDRKD